MKLRIVGDDAKDPHNTTIGGPLSLKVTGNGFCVK